MDKDVLIEFAALAECASSHPISVSLKNAYGKDIEMNRVKDIKEYAGMGITATVDANKVAAGNEKLMESLGIKYKTCHMEGTIIHLAVNGQYEGHIIISDVIKKETKEALSELKKAGLKKNIMLTGDSAIIGALTLSAGSRVNPR